MCIQYIAKLVQIFIEAVIKSVCVGCKSIKVDSFIKTLGKCTILLLYHTIDDYMYKISSQELHTHAHTHTSPCGRVTHTQSMSCSTMTTSTMTDASMQIVKVTLNMGELKHTCMHTVYTPIQVTTYLGRLKDVWVKIEVFLNTV